MDTPGETIFAPETFTDPPDKVTDCPLSARTRILPGSSVCTTTPAPAPCRMVAVTPFDTTTSAFAGAAAAAGRTRRLDAHDGLLLVLLAVMRPRAGRVLVVAILVALLIRMVLACAPRRGVAGRDDQRRR